MEFITGTVGLGRSLAVLVQAHEEPYEDEDGDLVEEDADWRARFWRDGAWTSDLALDFKPAAVTRTGIDTAMGGTDRWAVLGCGGEVLWVDAPTGPVDAGTGGPTARRDEVIDGLFTAATPYRNGVAVAGMGEHVYWSDGGPWTPVGDGRTATNGTEALAVLDGELYAVGWGGEIWYLDGVTWRRADAPTAMILTCAVALQTGELLVSGRCGTVLRGRRDSWVSAVREPDGPDLWSAAAFRGRSYVSSLTGIHELVDGELVMVDDETAAASYYHLSANDRILASFGADALLVTDGTGWQELT